MYGSFYKYIDIITQSIEIVYVVRSHEKNGSV